MFYFLPATGAGTGKNRLPEDTTHAPVSGSWQPVPVTGTGNRSVYSQHKLRCGGSRRQQMVVVRPRLGFKTQMLKAKAKSNMI